MNLTPFLLKSIPNLSKNSISVYQRNIDTLNNKEPYNDLDFLKDYKKINEKISKYKDTTKRNYFTSIFIVLNAYDSEKYKDAIKHYKDKAQKLQIDINKGYAKNQMTDKEKTNFLNYDELLDIQKEYENKINLLHLDEKTSLNSKQNKLLLHYLISSLYTLHSPLRLDWAGLKIVSKKSEMTDDKQNYLLNQGKFTKYVYLNDFKNVKSIGKQNFL
mgnify:CR=1 FL=1